MRKLILVFVSFLSASVHATDIKFENVQAGKLVVCDGYPTDYGSAGTLTPHVIYANEPFTPGSLNNFEYLITNDVKKTNEGVVSMVGRPVAGIDTMEKAFDLLIAELGGSLGQLNPSVLSSFIPNFPLSVVKGEVEQKQTGGTKTRYKLLSFGGLRTEDSPGVFKEFALTFVFQISYDLTGKKSVGVQPFYSVCTEIKKTGNTLTPH